jgi:anthranilate/para-aminobenzoate synthase component II
VQFHPESILSMRGDAGHKLIANLLATVTGRNI